MLNNSAFRDLLDGKDGDSGASAAKEDSRANKAAKQAKAKAAYEKRMEVQKRREERLAEQSR